MSDAPRELPELGLHLDWDTRLLARLLDEVRRGVGRRARVLEHRWAGLHLLGGGLRYVTGTSLRTNGVADIGNYEFKDTTSPVAEIEYLYSPQLGFKLRYVNDKFKFRDFDDTVRGDHVGALVNFYF